LVAGAGSFSAPVLFSDPAGVDSVLVFEAPVASSAESLAPKSGADAPESALAELVLAEEALSVSAVFESELAESEEFESLLSAVDESESVLSAEDESEDAESWLSAVDESEPAEALVLESAVSESEESEDLVSAESEEESELADFSLSEESEESEEEDVESEESEESDDLESEELVSELSELLSDALVEADSAADACVGAAMPMTKSTSPHRAAARTAILRALTSGRAHSVVPMPVTSRRASSKRGTVSPTVLQFQPRGVSRRCRKPRSS
jgi:hypothetical protein